MGVAAPVHPRGRGEHFGRSYDGRSGFGSSPRARGTHLTFLGKQYDPRFIPAGAGNTSPPRPPPWPRPVHPRGRGEHLSRSSCSSGVSGSSPRARGTRREVGPVVGLIRFIPAGAGNTGDIRSDKDVIRGSSPRARGTRQALLFTGELRRFIPAGAGNTELKFEIQKPNPVHPRGRGEHCSWMESGSHSCGSSPRARGTLVNPLCDDERQRFIPAGAGNTTWRRCRRLSSAVHPRGRGEHFSHLLWYTSRTGSSPRARGTRLMSGRALAPVRFIPAGAGNTEQEPLLCSTRTVHPRGRGEHHDVISAVGT